MSHVTTSIYIVSSDGRYRLWTVDLQTSNDHCTTKCTVVTEESETKEKPQDDELQPAMTVASPDETKRVIQAAMRKASGGSLLLMKAAAINNAATTSGTAALEPCSSSLIGMRLVRGKRSYASYLYTIVIGMLLH